MNQSTVLTVIRSAALAVALAFCVAPVAAADTAPSEGKVLVFWASWCGYCKEALKTVDSMAAQNQLSGYEAVAVNLPNDRKDPEQYLQDLGVKMPSAELAKLRDAGTGVIGVPWVVMVDADGNVIAGKRAPRSPEQMAAWVGSMDQVHQQLSMLR